MRVITLALAQTFVPQRPQGTPARAELGTLPAVGCMRGPGSARIARLLVTRKQLSVADQHGSPQKGAILDLGQDEVCNVGARDRGDAAERHTFADPIATSSGTVGEGYGIHPRPVEPAATESA